jgi:hypothetical protein
MGHGGAPGPAQMGGEAMSWVVHGGRGGWIIEKRR